MAVRHDLIAAEVRCQELASVTVSLATHIVHADEAGREWGNGGEVYVNAARNDIAQIRAALDFIEAALPAKAKAVA